MADQKPVTSTKEHHMTNKGRKTRVWHPLLISIAPVLSLYITNRHSMNAMDMLPVALALLLFVSVLWFLLNLLIRNPNKSGLIASVVMVLMFTYQNLVLGANVVYVVTGAMDWVFQIISKESFLVYCLLFEILVAALIAIKVIRAESNLTTLTGVVNVFSALLLGVILTSWIPSEVTSAKGSSSTSRQFTESWNRYIDSEPCYLQKDPNKPLPDIYVIILDAYGRDDVLRDVYNFDNSGFLAELEKRGFFVARNARSNYRHTKLTTASLFNLDYLESLADTSGLDVLNYSNSRPVIQNNRTFHQLKCLGYTLTAVDTNYFFTQFGPDVKTLPVGTYPSYFAYQFADTTPLTLLSLPSQYETARQRMSATVNALQSAPAEKSPKLVFADIMAAHDPFVFDALGRPVDPPRMMRFDNDHFFKELMDREGYTRGYREQVTYVSTLALETVDKILAESKTPPIILMFGDHGPTLSWDNISERMSIFSSYYFPGQKTGQLYEGISPVNSMRVVFNTYFGTDLAILPYRGNFAQDTNLYEYQDMSNKIPDNVYFESGK